MSSPTLPLHVAGRGRDVAYLPWLPLAVPSTPTSTGSATEKLPDVPIPSSDVPPAPVQFCLSSSSVSNTRSVIAGCVAATLAADPTIVSWRALRPQGWRLQARPPVSAGARRHNLSSSSCRFLGECGSL